MGFGSATRTIYTNYTYTMKQIMEQKGAVAAEFVSDPKYANYKSGGGLFGGLRGIFQGEKNAYKLTYADGRTETVGRGPFTTSYVDSGWSGPTSIVNPIAQVAKASLQVATLGNANAVIKPLQEVARNPIVQAVAVGALTVYTGGLAAAAMGGGAVATAGGTMLASAAVGKAQGQSFNLQNSLVTGATAGVGEYAKGAELLSNATANAAAVSSLTNAVQGKLQGKAFNLQDTLQAGAEAGIAKWGAPKGDVSIMPIPNPVADFVQGAKAVYQLKQAVDTMHNQQAQADQAKAVAQQQTAQFNADQAHIDAVKKEIAALDAQAAQAKQSPQQQPQTSTAQTYTASEKMAAASVLLGLLKLFA